MERRHLAGECIGPELVAGRVPDDELIDVHEEGMVDALEAEQEMAAHPLDGNAGGSAKP